MPNEKVLRLQNFSGRPALSATQALFVFDDWWLDVTLPVKHELDDTEHFREFAHKQRYGSPPILPHGTLAAQEQPEYLERIDQ